VNPNEYRKAYDARVIAIARLLIAKQKADGTFTSVADCYAQAKAEALVELPLSLKEPWSAETRKKADQQAIRENGPAVVWIWEPGRKR
jgi:hypothetical protein